MENEKKIWAWLKEHTELNDYAVAGIMGNIQAESAGLPNNLENRAELLLGISDEEYTAAVDGGRYTKSDFARDGGVCGGYGLCQWTYYTRKMALYDYCMAKGVSIAHLESQLEFMVKEMREQYANMWKKLLKAKTVKEASDAVLTDYERPAKAEAQKAKRAEFGVEIYGRNGGPAPASTPSVSCADSSPCPGGALEGENALKRAAELIEEALKLIKGE